jgi:hypothetical protein
MRWWVLGLLTALLVAGGCSERIVENPDVQSDIVIDIDRGAALSFEAAPSVFRVIVAYPRTNEIVAEGPLSRDRAQLVGTIGPLPAYRDLRFTVEAADEATGAVLYRGSKLAQASPYRSTTLAIDLFPVAPLIKFTPRYVVPDTDSTFAVTTKIFNVPGLYGLAYRVNWPLDVSLAVDSLALNPALAADSTIIFFAQPGQTAAIYYAFSITESDRASEIVGTDGSADLVTIYFHDMNPVSTFPLTLEVTSISTIQNGQIDSLPVATVFADECLVDASTAVPVK